MKSSNDNTPLLVGLFVLAAIIIALIVYYTRPGETKTSEQTSDTTELTVENLTFERTLNPDPSVGNGNGVSGYTIEPYGIEYDIGDVQYKALSQNVTFTMGWTNSPGFNNVVKGFKIEHYVKPDPTDTVPTPESVKEQDLIKKTTAVSPETISISDFGACTAKIVSIATGDNAYSVIGQNSFKLYAVVLEVDKTFDWGTSNTQKDVLLYDGTAETTEPPELKISKDQLSVTLTMTSAETISYTPESITSTTTSTIIEKTAYKITNNAATLNIGKKGLYLSLIPQTMGKYFNFTYEDGDYLRDDLTKGPVTTTNGKTKFKFEIVDKDGSVGKIRQVSTETDDSKSKFLSSDGTTLKLYTKTHEDLNATRFAGFKWTFASWNPVDCEGTYENNWSACSNQCGTGTQTKNFIVSQQPNDMGKACLENKSQECSSDAGCDVNCVGAYGDCYSSQGCGWGVLTYNVSTQKKNNGATCKDANGVTVNDGDTKSCFLGSCGSGSYSGGGGQ